MRFATLVHAVRLALAAVAMAVLAIAAQAQQQAPLVGIDPIRTAITDIETAIRRGGLSSRELADYLQTLSPLRDDLRTKLADLQPQLADLDARLKQLGPPPAAGAPPEDAAITAERAKLTQDRSDMDAAVKQVQLLQTRADQLATTLAERQRAAYAERLLKRTPNVLDPFFWVEVVGALPDEARRAVTFVRDAKAYALEKGGTTRLLFVALALVGIAVAAFGLNRWWRRIALVGRAESRFGKAIASFLVFARAFFVMPAITMVVLELLDQFDLFAPDNDRIARALVFGVAVAALARAAGLAVLAPQEPARRLIDVDDLVAAWLYGHLVWSGRLLGISGVLRAVHRSFGGPQPIGDAIQILSALAIAVLLIHLLASRRLFREEQELGRPALHVPGIRLLAWLVVAGIAGSLLTGYAVLASFISGRAVFAVELVAALYLVLLVTDAVVGSTLSPESTRGRFVAGQLGVNPRRVGLFGALVSGVLRAVFVLIVLALVVGRSEMAASDFFDAIRGVSFGLKIGDISISLGAVLGALAIFAIALILTRIVQRWLEKEVLPHTAIEPSLRLSIATVFGYVGFIIALVFGLSELGIDLQKIALVAGALSVGIGFGLQAVVSNFVSGLILLAERPIRIGDQIVVKNEEGYVRRISVRSTEIETFDRATVIVPNSELITGVVKNWTRVNMLGRVVLKIAVAYGSDAEQVRDILAECTKAHPQVLQTPAPAVLLAELGDHGLRFEVYGIVADLGAAGSIKSDLYFEVLKRFRAAGIEIAYPQREIRIIGAPSDEPHGGTKLA